VKVARQNPWILAGYGGLLGFFVLERLLRRPGDASALTASERDQGTTWLIIAAYAAATDLPLVSRRLPMGRLPPAVAPAGLAVQAAGLALRAHSMRTLGASYTRTLRTEGEQQVLVKTGAYRVIRHPGYLGSLLTWTGFALTSRSLPTIALISGLLGVAYGRRISAEEQMLRRQITSYEQYAERTARLIPFVW
jgi:protein-S-isoprenylcysteine O-methyltransferase Ste14